MTKEKSQSLVDEFYHKKKKEPSKLTKLLLQIISKLTPKTTKKSTTVKPQKEPFKLNLLDRAPVSFNLGLTYIMLVGLILVMILSNSVLIWLLGIPTIYAFYRHIKLEKNKVADERR